MFSAFSSDGSLKEGHRNRLVRVLKAADDCGMIVIVNLFYWKQIRHQFSAREWQHSRAAPGTIDRIARNGCLPEAASPGLHQRRQRATG
jgi:hypothetical protein